MGTGSLEDELYGGIETTCSGRGPNIDNASAERLTQCLNARIKDNPVAPAAGGSIASQNLVVADRPRIALRIHVSGGVVEDGAHVHAATGDCSRCAAGFGLRRGVGI